MQLPAQDASDRAGPKYLNTPETSLSGNLWGMPLRMIVDQGLVAAEDVALVGARNLDPGELEFLASSGIDEMRTS